MTNFNLQVIIELVKFMITYLGTWTAKKLVRDEQTPILGEEFIEVHIVLSHALLLLKYGWTRTNIETQGAINVDIFEDQFIW